MAFLMYADDNRQHLPTGTDVEPGGLWYFQVLSQGRYITGNTITNYVWRCPAVQDGDIQTIFGARWEGYGPVESTIICYAFHSPGGIGPWGSQLVTSIHRPAQLWLMGDTGVPKNPAPVPPSGYLTEIVTFPPDPQAGWSGWVPQKQPACRHDKTANVTFVDGHIEAWRYADFRANKNNIFGEGGNF